ncbi:MAG TPA: aconitase/3-isopropylmalate dehydratase large subunit family protein [bacterium]|nr:aconitase/3-isopropylmalate dehydratase large subunit family protein [bacterium]
MGQTMIEKIMAAHSGRQPKPGDIVDVAIDVRVARDFGGANVVKHMEDHGLGVADPKVTFFTFDCNPTGSDQKYAANQQKIRLFAARHGIKVYDITEGIGTHIAIDEGLIGPGSTIVSTDSHANIVGAIGAFGQGMGDQDIAAAFAAGRVWFKVPPTVRIWIEGKRGADITAKDITLALLKVTGASGLLGVAAEVYGSVAEAMTLAERITLSSMATEMGAIIIFFPPSPGVLRELKQITGKDYQPLSADKDARYERDIKIDLTGMKPLVALPGNPENVVPVSEAQGTKIHSAFIGSCTNGRFEDILAAADVLTGRHVAPGIVLKIVPSTDRIWKRCCKEGLFQIFKEAGALVGNAGCAGCAAGQIGMNGPGEVTVSTGNRNFPGKQGQGEVYLASPAVAAASAVRGMIVAPAEIDARIEPRAAREGAAGAGAGVAVGARPKAGAGVGAGTGAGAKAGAPGAAAAPLKVTGRVWVVGKNNIDTDMIYHNKHLAVTDVKEMAKYCFGNLEGWKDFPERAKPGDIVVVGKNFGCGSSRQHAVDCFASLGIQAVIGESFGAIYERNAINAGLPIVEGSVASLGLKDGDTVTVDFLKGEVTKEPGGPTAKVAPFSDVQLQIYKRGGLLNK